MEREKGCKGEVGECCKDEEGCTAGVGVKVVRRGKGLG